MTPLDFALAAALFAATFSTRLWLNTVKKPWRNPRAILVIAVTLVLVVGLTVWALQDNETHRAMWFVMAVNFGIMAALVIGLVIDSRSRRHAHRRA